jgi:hypothetical protein
MTREHTTCGKEQDRPIMVDMPASAQVAATAGGDEVGSSVVVPLAIEVIHLQAKRPGLVLPVDGSVTPEARLRAGT